MKRKNVAWQLKHEEALMTLLATINRTDMDRVRSLLDENGYEGRYEWSKQRIGNSITLIIHEDYEDLPGLHEILNSIGIQVHDHFLAEGEVYQAYELNHLSDCLEEDTGEEFIPISIPAHFIQDPIEDRL